MSPLRTLMSLACMALAFLASANTGSDGCDYYTARLDSLAGRVRIGKVSGLSPDQSLRFAVARPDGKADSLRLHLRTNAWGEAAHLGYDIFDDGYWDLMPWAAPVLEFLERSTLEVLVPDPVVPTRQMLQLGGVHFWTGDFETLTQLQGNETIDVHIEQLRRCDVEIRRDGKEVVTMAFPADVQLMTGCNSAELDSLLIVDLRRAAFAAPQLPPVAGQDDEVTVDGGWFLNNEIASRLFYQRDRKSRKGADAAYSLYADADRSWRKCLHNFALSGDDRYGNTLQLTVDCYGYRTGSVSLPMSQWTRYCLQRGCKLYLGIKEKDAQGVIHATVYAVSEMSGYCHMLVLDCPEQALKDSGVAISGRMYGYIPLFNVSDDFFKAGRQYNQGKNATEK